MVAKKLVVRVERARNLMAKDGQGSTSAYVQVVFDGIRKTTRVIKRDLDPIWEETMEFSVHDAADMENEVLEVTVFDSSWRPVGKSKSKFLGRVSLHGSTFVKKGQEALRYYKLDKRGLFSLVRGELGLAVYYVDDDDAGVAASSMARGPLNADRSALSEERAPLNAERASMNADRAPSSGKRVAFHGPKSPGRRRELPPIPENQRDNGECRADQAAPRTTESGAAPPSTAAAKSSPQRSRSMPTRPPPNPTPARPDASQSSGKPSSNLPPSTAEHGRRHTPLPPSNAMKASFKQNHDHSPSLADMLPMPNAPPNLPPTDQKTGLSDKPPPSSPPPAPSETPSPSPEVLPVPNLADPSPEDLRTPSSFAESREMASTSPGAELSEPEGAQSVAEEPQHPQSSGELYESVAEGRGFEMNAAAVSFEGSQSAVEDLENVEEVQSSITQAEYALKETRPEFGGEDKSGRADLVETRRYLYVRVEKARSLMPKHGLVIPNSYALVAFGNQIAKTDTIPNSLSPEWNQAFAFEHRFHDADADAVEISLWHQPPSPAHDISLGAVFFHLLDVPSRLPPDSPSLAPQWYHLEPEHGEHGLVPGDVMLSVWIGTQADEAFPDAWRSDAGGGQVAMTRAKVYLSPKLWYLRITIIEGQDLQTRDAPRQLPEASVKVQLGFQTERSRVAKRRSISPFWNEELILVASEPFEDSVLLTVEDHKGPDRYEIIGMVQIPLEKVERRVDDRKVASRWFNLQHDLEETDVPFRPHGRIHLRICLDGGYHVMDEAAHLGSDMRPSARQLWKPPIGVLELGILGAHNLLPMKNKGGRGTTDAYCVAKYGPKWVRTRTVLDSLSPRWNEQYTWEVYDPCTVLTLCVFDNGELVEDQENRHQHNKHARIGKVRVRLSTLEVDRVYTISYPLLVLQPGGLQKEGDMEVAVRFSCVSMLHLIHTYSKPLLPRMHYLHPLSLQQQEVLRTTAMKLVALRLAQSEPPLRPEVVQYLLDADSSLWSMRRSRANWFRISHMMGGFYAMLTWLKDICQWRHPVTTLLVHVLFVILLCYPELVLPTIFFYMFLIGLWQFRSRNRSPPHIDPRISHADVADRDELDEEFDTSPTSKPPDVIKLRYERLRGIAGRIQMVLGDVAMQGERLHGLLTWRDPRATSIFVVVCLVTAVSLYIAPFRLAALLVGIYFLRHPRFRGPLPSAALNFFQRLPTQADRIL